jgi:hypothetical protein
LLTAATWTILALCAGLTLAAGLSRNRVPLAVSVVVGAVLRITFAAITSQTFTPQDSRTYFRMTGELILQGRDPLHMPGRQWNFLDLMPFVHALELRSGLPWVYALKIAPIAADLVLVWLVAQFAPRDGRTRALQYAVNPLSLLVVSLHGQVEPVALAMALSGALLIRKNRPLLGGILLGGAVAAKTWPAVILLAVLPIRDLPRVARILAGSTVVPLLCLLSGVLFLDTQPIADLKYLASYSSFVFWWTWSGTLIELGHPQIAGYDSSISPVASSLIALGVIVTLILLRNRPPEARALGVLCAILICTAGFGTQYLLWPLPLMIALSGPSRNAYVIAASWWAAVFYVSLAQAANTVSFLRGLSWLPAAMLLAILIEQVIFAKTISPQADGLVSSKADDTGLSAAHEYEGEKWRPS